MSMSALTPGDLSAVVAGVRVTLGGVPSEDVADGIPGYPIEAVNEMSRMIALALSRAGAQGPEVFRRTRHALGLREDDAAWVLAVSSETVVAWERGSAPPDRNAFAVLAAMLREIMGDPMTVREHVARMAEPFAAMRVDWSPGDRVRWRPGRDAGSFARAPA